MRRTRTQRSRVDHIDAAHLNIEAEIVKIVPIAEADNNTDPSPQIAEDINLCSQPVPMLTWKERIFARNTPQGCSHLGVLWEFINLADAKDEEVLRFAQKHGVLSIAVEYLGKSWKRSPVNPPSAWRQIPKNEAQNYWLYYQEPVEEYRKLARQVDNLLSIAVGLREGKISSVSGVQAVVGVPQGLSTPFYNQLALMRGVEDLLQRIKPTVWLNVNPDGSAALQLSMSGMALVNSKLGEHDLLIGLGVSKNETAPRPNIPRPSALYVAIVLQLIGVLTLKDGLYRCDICGRFFPSENRKLRADRKRLCSDDCREKAHRAHVRASNKRRALARRTFPDRRRSKE